MREYYEVIGDFIDLDVNMKFEEIKNLLFVKWKEFIISCLILSIEGLLSLRLGWNISFLIC